MIRDPLARYAGYQAIVEGVDTGRAPSILTSTQLVWLVNAVTRGGFPTTRPGWEKTVLGFLDETGNVDTVLRTRFRTGRWQGAWPYYADSGAIYIVASIGGRLFRIDTQTRAVEDLTGGDATLLNLATQPHTWFVQAENYLVIQNASDGALIYDGATLRRSQFNGSSNRTDVPPGSVMEYNNGRLWVASPTGDKFVAGDLVYSVTGTRADVLGFTENTYLNGGGYFVVPASAGRIVAMRSIAVQDNPTGQGPLQVITTRGGFSVDAPYNREEWQNTRSPIITISLMAAGGVSQAATTLVNGDIWFRALDGIRSYVVARRDHGTWVNTPLSREVSRAIDHDTPSMLEYASSTLFDNRFLCTTQPSLVTVDGVVRGIAHKGLLVLDFAPVSQMFHRGQPVWDGVWTGLSILQVLSTEGPTPRAWLFALNSDHDIELWEMTRTGFADINESVTTRIQWSIETPSYGFDTGGWNLRELAYGDFWVNDLRGQVNLSFQYRCDNDQSWQDWSSVAFCATAETCDLEACTTPGSYLPQYRPRVRLPAPGTTCDTATGKPRNQGYRFASRIAITGHATLSQFRLAARNLPEEAEGACPPSACELQPVTGCLTDDYTYSIL